MSRWDSLKPIDDKQSKSSLSTSNSNTTRRFTTPQNVRQRNQDHQRKIASSKQQLGKAPRYRQVPAKKSVLDGGTLMVLKNELQQLQDGANQNKTVNLSSMFTSLKEVEMNLNDYSQSQKLEIFSLCIETIKCNVVELEQPVGRILGKILSDNTIHFQESQIWHGISVLSSKFVVPGYFHFIEALIYLVRNNPQSLPAENTARLVVEKIFLSCLGDSSVNDANKRSILDAVSVLLNNSQHASALLGSLIQDVSTDGVERIVANPLRRHLVTTVLTFLRASGKDDQAIGTQVIACTVLSQIVNTLSQIEPNCTLSSAYIELPEVENFISLSLTKQKIVLYEPCLVLLQSFVRHHANEITGIVSSIILTPIWDVRDNKVDACRYCCIQTSELGQFMRLVHVSSARSVGVTQSNSKIAISCLAECIKSMPWKRWFGLPNLASARSGFGRRLVDSVGGIIDITRCNFLCCDEDTIDPILQLSKNLFIEIPYSDNDKMTKKAIELLVTLADVVFCDKRTKKIQQAAFVALIHSMGGWETPQGETVPMCLPASQWLSKESSKVFLKLAVTSIQSNDNKIDTSYRFLSAIFRSRPETALQISTDFSDIVKIGLENDNSGTRLHLLHFLEAFMLGRKHYAANYDELTMDAMAQDVLTILKRTRDDDSVQCRCLSFNIYSTLLTRDWIATEVTGENILYDHFQAITIHCQESNSKVKSAACKALGEFCSAYFSSTRISEVRNNGSFTRRIMPQAISKPMLKSMDDKNASVRAMSQFCIGNLAYAIRELNDDDLLDEPTLLQLCKRVQEALQDSNDKVAGNAIRSIGHLGYLLFRRDFQTHAGEKLQIQLDILSSLAHKISKALSLGSDEKNTMTWKQRSVTKKHGWGASNAVSLLFQHADLEAELLVRAHSNVLGLLFACVEKGSALSEKIACSAMMAIRSLPPIQLSDLANKSGLVGEGIVACILNIYGAEETQVPFSSKVLEESRLLLFHLLGSATILDASTVLRRDDFPRSVRRFLYSWMVANGASSHSFEIFALAFQRPGLKSTDVLLEQNFASRALQERKKDSPGAITDDDGDEL